MSAPLTISCITVFADLYGPFLKTSLIGRAQQNKLVDISVTSLFSFVSPKQRIDAPAYGHGAGMLIRPDVVQKAIEEKEQSHGRALRIFFSPQGQKIDQQMLEELALQAQKIGHLMLVAARYEGVDVRVEQLYADKIVSVGDFVLMGGDLPALFLIEGLLRLIPGVVGKQESVEQDSFVGPFVDHEHYTNPVEWRGETVPDILRSGNHEKIRQWRLAQAAKKSVVHHFDWVRTSYMNQEQRSIAQKMIPPHYIALLHADVFIGNQEQVGTTSVTSLDIHDIARSARTYDLRQFFIVTPLQDQQKIVKKLLSFWQTEEGVEYNKNRHEALNQVCLADTLDQVIASIEKQEGVKPILIASSARHHVHANYLTFFDQEKVWSLERPVLFLLGTGKGLSEQIIQRADFLFVPLEGFSDFNHLSVRSAAAVLFDRWLGVNVRPTSFKKFIYNKNKDTTS